MSSKEAWQIFVKTGSIIDYLVYKRIQDNEFNKK